MLDGGRMQVKQVHLGKNTINAINAINANDSMNEASSAATN